jgi:hypothetical protein
MSSDEIDKILSRIGTKVNYIFPGDEKSQHGILTDRSVFESQYGGAVPYWDVVDLIEFEGGKERECIRIGYYRKPRQNLNWGSQTTITETLSGWKGLLVKAAREKKWFRALLDDVMSELEKSATH